MLGQRFWSKVESADALDCWNWIGTLEPSGYGSFGVKIDGHWKNRKAHRLAYEDMVAPVRRGKHLDHLCRNRRCVNPYHLEPVTAKVNHSRGVGNKRQRPVVDHHEYHPTKTYLRGDGKGNAYRVTELITSFKGAMKAHHETRNYESSRKRNYLVDESALATY